MIVPDASSTLYVPPGRRIRADDTPPVRQLDLLRIDPERIDEITKCDSWLTTHKLGQSNISGRDTPPHSIGDTSHTERYIPPHARLDSPLLADPRNTRRQKTGPLYSGLTWRVITFLPDDIEVVRNVEFKTVQLAGSYKWVPGPNPTIAVPGTSIHPHLPSYTLRYLTFRCS